ncbi:MAG: response regulator [Longimicrobiales bacterium]|nr:response regulator [Longimicrobiales bacterium]
MPRRILIVEDDADVRRALTIRLKAAGYDVTTAVDGASAGASARDLPPDLVLLDLGLPGGDGYAVMDRLRRIGRMAHVPVVVLSARDPRTEESRSKAAGAVAFLTKPPDPAHLLHVIAENLWQVEAKAGSVARILVVEDDRDTRTGLIVRLESHGFDVVEAVDAASAVAVGVRERPDLILLDLGLPAGDGFALLRRFRSHGALFAVPVIVLSARDPATNRTEALDAGAVEYFQKPADDKALLEAIRRALRGS